MQRAQKRGVLPAFAAAIAAIAVSALPAAGGADAARGDCVAPHLLGVSLSEARHTLAASGCAVKIRQLPAHGRYVTPSSPDGRQLVGRQSPSAGSHSQAVTVWVKPLCAQSALPAPMTQG